MRLWLLLLCVAITGLTQLVGAQDPATLARADTLFARKEWKTARALYDRLVNDGQATADAYFKRAVCNDRLAAGREAVLTDLGEALRRDPRHFKSLLFRSKMYYNNLMFDRSLEDLNAALDCAPDTAAIVDCLTERGSVHHAVRAFDEALLDHGRALELDSSKHAALGRMANSLESLGRTEEALRLQIRYTERVPDDYIGYMNVGFYLAKAERFQEALTWYGKAWEHGGEKSPELWNNRGYVRYRLGDLDGAMKDVRKSLKLREWNPYAHRNLALVCIAMNRTDEACTALEMALKWGFTARYGDEVQKLYAAHCR